ncbi:MAG: hypothetical protein ISQ88_11750 [Rhodobacteraceae bacterium]|nr:hypothetical protein [Paracoccaceae bacterium]
MAGFLAPLIPLAGKALFWGGSAAGAAAGAHGLMGIPQNRREELIRQGPNDITGKYDLNILDKLMLDEDSLGDSRNKYIMDTAKKDGRVLEAQGLNSSLQLTNGMTADDFVNKYRTQIQNDKLNQKIDEAGAINTATYNSPQQIEERRVRDEQRGDLLREQRLSREDTNNRFLYSERTGDKRRAHEASEGKLNRRHQSELADQSNNMQMQMSIMSNDLSEKRMDYDRETRRMDKRSAAIAQLMSGLGSLGGAFAL